MIRLVLLLCVACGAVSAHAQGVVGMSVQELQAALVRGDLSALTVTQTFLQRIKAVDDDGPSLNAVIEINPDAPDIAAALDAKAQKDGPVGPLHGIPVLLKANIDTGDKMATTAGSIALADHRARHDAFHVARLRAAGAVILGKTNLSEWANFRSETSVSGWSSLGGQTKNPYATDRNPCGSSSGSGVAVSARLAPLAVGTETNGSIVCPAGINGIVGIKPTVGLISRSGIIPISHTQDTAGPMANSVYGAALLLESMVGYDPADEASVQRTGSYLPDAGKSLSGVRIGVWRGYHGAQNKDVGRVFDAGVEALSSLGAEIIDPVEIAVPDSLGAAEYEVFLYEFKAGLNAYLARHDVDERVDTLAELIAFNEANAGRALPVFGQDIFMLAQTKGDLSSAAYLQALEDSHRTMRAVLDGVLKSNRLDAIVAPTNSPSWKTDWVNGDFYSLSSSSLAAVSGYPSITVPAGFVDGLPIGLTFIGAAFVEQKLIQYAYAFEQQTRARREPEFLPRVALENDL